MNLKNQKGIVNTAIVALVIGLILLSIGIYLSKDKSNNSASKQKTENSMSTDTKSDTSATTPANLKTTTPSPELKKAPPSDAEIDKQLQQLILDEKNITNAIDDKPIDVMAE